MQPAICGHCQKAFTPKPKDKGRFCSHACVRAAMRTPKSWSVCGHCAKAFIPKEHNRRSFCSRECAYQDRREKKVARREALRREAMGKRASTVKCAHCGSETAYRPGSKYCPDGCSKEAADERVRAVNASRKTKVNVCSVCSAEFTRPYGDKTRSFCSLACLKQRKSEYKTEQKQRRRARMRQTKSEVFRHRDVFDRDGWVCHLCQLPVDSEQRVPHPMAPTIDHVIPIPKGGEHTKANVRLAHFRCNSVRGVRPIEAITEGAWHPFSWRIDEQGPRSYTFTRIHSSDPGFRPQGAGGGA